VVAYAVAVCYSSFLSFSPSYGTTQVEEMGMIVGRVRWTTMMTKAVVRWRKVLSVSPKQRRNALQMSSGKNKRKVFWWNSGYFCFLFCYLFEMAKEVFSLYAPINLSFHSGQLDEINRAGPDLSYCRIRKKIRMQTREEN
jgi:hypothetical protein